MGHGTCGCGDAGCETEESTGNGLCPYCGVQGLFVKNNTVRHVVKESGRGELGLEDYYLCLEANCPSGYFNNELNKTILLDHFKRPVWFKSGADPLYDCYCKSITEDEVVTTVVETGLSDRKAISTYLKGGVGDNCEITSPLGKCCSDGFNLMVRNGLTVKFVLEQYSHLKPNSKTEEEQVAVAMSASCGCGGNCACAS